MILPQWTASALQSHPWALLVCDEDATLELRVKTGENGGLWMIRLGS